MRKAMTKPHGLDRGSRSGLAAPQHNLAIALGLPTRTVELVYHCDYEIILVGSVAGRCLGAVVVNLRSTPLRLAFGTC